MSAAFVSATEVAQNQRRYALAGSANADAAPSYSAKSLGRFLIDVTSPTATACEPSTMRTFLPTVTTGLTSGRASAETTNIFARTNSGIGSPVGNDEPSSRMKRGEIIQVCGSSA